MTFRLAIASHKGGVGKSTIALNLAVAFAKSGYKTAIIDTDPQGGLNLALGKGSLEFRGLADVLAGREDLNSVLITTNIPSLTMLTKGHLPMFDVPDFEKQIFETSGLVSISEALATDHDLLVYDTPAGMGMITRAVFRVASHVLVPFKVDSVNLRSMNQILQVIEAVQNQENPNLNYLGMVLNMFEKDKDRSFRIAGEVWQNFPEVLDTTIPYSDIFSKASELAAPLALLGKREHPEAKRFTSLAGEILNAINPAEESYDHARQLL